MRDTDNATMEDWETSRYGLGPESDGRDDEERYPPPAATPPEDLEPSGEGGQLCRPASLKVFLTSKTHRETPALAAGLFA